METCPRWADRQRWVRRVEVDAWNQTHPDDQYERPALVEPERVPDLWDDLDLDLTALIWGGEGKLNELGKLALDNGFILL